ncbi:MAG: anion transporter, partial [Candidatus Heimdallarchaeaceae archaeon]
QLSINNTFAEPTPINKKLLWLSLSLFVLFIVALEFDWLFYISPVVFLVFLILSRDTIKRCNWSLILIFILMFLNVNLFLDITFIAEKFAFLSQSDTLLLYITGIGLSQIISNVPASIFLAAFSNNWLVIAFSVNIAGNGTIISSLANLITLKLSQVKKFLPIFHLYSLPFLLISSIIGYFLFFI